MLTMNEVSVTLRELALKDWPLVQSWADGIGWMQYMSRIHPYTFTPEEFPNRDNVCWYVIMVDGRDVGTVWLEKKTPQDDTAILGILIGDPQLHGRGIGRRTIRLAIEAARPRLHFDCVELHTRLSNTRAIACYTQCGFRLVSEGVKVLKDGSRVEYCTMQLQLKYPAT